MLFEPRDEATWDAVYPRAREAGQTLIWLGIRQQQEADEGDWSVTLRVHHTTYWPPIS